MTSLRPTSLCPSFSTSVVQTVLLPLAVPPATPIMKGVLGAATELRREGEEQAQPFPLVLVIVTGWQSKILAEFLER